MFKRLAEPGLYAAALEQVAAKQHKRRLFGLEVCPGGPSLEQLQREVRPVSRKLAKLVASCAYRLSPLVPRVACIEGRDRLLYRATPLDQVVMTALAQVLGQQLEPSLSGRLFSYRRGYSTLGALHEASAYLREHLRARSEPRSRGVYTVRRDVRAYGDSIPAGDDAPLWPRLAESLRSAGQALDERQLAWLRSMIRPPVEDGSGSASTPTRGIPTGSPLQPIVGNLYLGQLDTRLEQYRDAFYARFGDDLLFMHAEPAVALAASEAIAEELRRLGLTLSESKCSTLFVTVPGRRSDLPAFVGQSSFDYLGRRLDARGAIGLTRVKQRRLLQNVDHRLQNVAALTRDLPQAERVSLLCGAVNHALDPAALTAERAAPGLAGEQTDQRQLRQLDYLLGLRVARVATGVRGVRAFRGLPVRTLRTKHGLVSLVARRLALRRSRAARDEV